MKKPAIRILLLVVLLGLAIFYFRYMREGFADVDLAIAPAVTTGTAALNANDLIASTLATAAAGSTVTAAKGSSCTTVGLTTTIKGTTMYCCKDPTGANKWSDKSCSS